MRTRSRTIVLETAALSEIAMRSSKPLIAVTMGDPAGIGPEIIVGAWTETVVHEWCRPLVVGHPEIIRRAVDLWQTGVEVVEIDSPEAGRAVARRDPLHSPAARTTCWTWRRARSTPGPARRPTTPWSRPIRLALAGRVDAITTAPLHKEALHRAGHDYPGHTELLADVCGVDDYAMMLYLGPNEELLSPAGLAVVHVTLHTALRNVFGQLTEEAILAKARLADRFMSRLMRPARGRSLAGIRQASRSAARGRGSASAR